MFHYRYPSRVSCIIAHLPTHLRAIATTSTRSPISRLFQYHISYPHPLDVAKLDTNQPRFIPPHSLRAPVLHTRAPRSDGEHYYACLFLLTCAHQAQVHHRKTAPSGRCRLRIHYARAPSRGPCITYAQMRFKLSRAPGPYSRSSSRAAVHYIHVIRTHTFYSLTKPLLRVLKLIISHFSPLAWSHPSRGPPAPTPPRLAPPRLSDLMRHRLSTFKISKSPSR